MAKNAKIGATYIDSSVLLRAILNEPGKWPELRDVTFGVTSELTKIECFRTIDRLRLKGHLDDAHVMQSRTLVNNFMKYVDIIRLDTVVLDLAAQPLPTTVGTLDAIHLASALLWQKKRIQSLLFATHDRQLDIGVKAMGFANPAWI